jgi:ketosteroid isomerase-like protein
MQYRYRMTLLQLLPSILLIWCCLFIGQQTYAQHKVTFSQPATDGLSVESRQAITALVEKQGASYSAGDIAGFMAYFWESDSLVFVSQTQIIRGWASLKRIHEQIAQNGKTGTLSGTVEEIRPIDNANAWVIGRWKGERPNEAARSGVFSLHVRQINNKWLIVAEHAS